MLRFALTILLSAFLLFLVQPLIGKAILPWFGGTPAVWTTCLLFFQTALLLGYAYSHFLVDYTTPRTQAVVHLIVLAVSLLWLPLAVSNEWTPSGEESPTWQVLGLLTVTLLGPYTALSATAPLLQSWFSHTQPGKSPYWLYALSNFGSLAALLAFPFFVERMLGTRDQLMLWSATYVVFLAFAAVCAASVFFAPEKVGEADPAPVLGPPLDLAAEVPREVKPEPKAQGKGKKAKEKKPAAKKPAAPPGRFDWMNQEITGVRWMSPTGEASATAQVLWVFLPFVSAMLLSATTNQLCQDVTVVPFLWIAPLALYLISFIFAFNFEHFYARRWWFAFLVVTEVWVTLALYMGGGAPFDFVVGAYSSLILFGCVMMHCELARLKPVLAKLTQFYLCMSLGGAMGGAYVALVAPAIFDGYWEFHLSLFLCFLMPLICAFGDPQSTIFDGKPKMVWISLLLTLAFFCVSWISHIQTASEIILEQRRGFFGVKMVKRQDAQVLAENETRPAQMTLQHGSTLHGSQFLDPELRDQPNSYYSVQSGVGLAMELHPRRLGEDQTKKGLHVGVVGLGAGTLAALAQPGDTMRFYEIDPQVKEIAENPAYFTYLKDSAANLTKDGLKIVLGDARVQLTRELADPNLPKFDVLVIDAFSGDSVPLHLLTYEAFEVYKKRMAPNGLLCMHVSNRYLDLTRVCRGAADALRWSALNLQTFPDIQHIREGANWVIIAQPDNPFLSHPQVNDPLSHETRPAPWGDRQPVLWTDDRSNLFDVMTPVTMYLDRRVESVTPVTEGTPVGTAP